MIETIFIINNYLVYSTFFIKRHSSVALDSPECQFDNFDYLTINRDQSKDNYADAHTTDYHTSAFGRSVSSYILYRNSDGQTVTVCNIFVDKRKSYTETNGLTCLICVE